MKLIWIIFWFAAGKEGNPERYLVRREKQMCGWEWGNGAISVENVTRFAPAI